MEASYAEGFAAVYNRHYVGFVASVAPAIHRLAQARGDGGGRRVLDLCCGTGQLVRYLADLGYEAVGVDRSAAMLAHARENAGAHLDAGTIRLIEGDVTQFVAEPPVDLVTSTFDALNHLPDMAALRKTLSCAYQSLGPGGLCVFDLHTPNGLRRLNHIQVRDDEEVLLVSRINYDPEHDRAFAHVSGVYSEPGRGWLRFDQHASVTAWSTGEVLDALAAAGFSNAVPSSLDALGEAVPDPDRRPRIYFVAER